MSWFSGKKQDKDEKKEKEENVSEVKPIQISADSNSFRLILGPQVTEKSSLLISNGKYVFKVGKVANKIEIKKMIEKMFKVKVVSVNIINVPSKKRVIGRHRGEVSGYKKAVVTLAAGDKIDIN